MRSYNPNALIPETGFLGFSGHELSKKKKNEKERKKKKRSRLSQRHYLKVSALLWHHTHAHTYCHTTCGVETGS